MALRSARAVGSLAPAVGVNGGFSVTEMTRGCWRCGPDSAQHHTLRRRHQRLGAGAEGREKPSHRANPTNHYS